MSIKNNSTDGTVQDACKEEDLEVNENQAEAEQVPLYAGARGSY